MTAAASARKMETPHIATTRRSTSAERTGTFAAANAGPMDGDTGRPSVVLARSISCSGMSRSLWGDSRASGVLGARGRASLLASRGLSKNIASAGASPSLGGILKEHLGRLFNSGQSHEFAQQIRKLLPIDARHLAERAD